MRLAAFARDGVDGAVASANRAAGAGTLDDCVRDERAAYLSGAAFFEDVGFVFVSEMLESRDDRIGGALAQATQAGELDLFAQVL